MDIFGYTMIIGIDARGGSFLEPIIYYTIVRATAMRGVLKNIQFHDFHDDTIILLCALFHPVYRK